mgnify:FL=1
MEQDLATGRIVLAEYEDRKAYIEDMMADY